MEITKFEKEMTDWEMTERVKPPWIKESIRYGKTVKPLIDQDNPQPLTDEMVLQSRTEKVGTNSMASPINGRGQDKGFVETSNSKQKHSDSGARRL